MGNTSNYCCNVDNHTKQQSPQEKREFLDWNEYQRGDKPDLIQLIKRQYDDSMLPNVKELLKQDRQKVLKLLASQPTAQKTHKKKDPSQNSPNSCKNKLSKIEINREENSSDHQLVVLHQKCQKIANMERQLINNSPRGIKCQKNRQLKGQEQSIGQIRNT